eukprot:m.31151 g.31151  ORF g.31151 m.31151 type:complete len:389 (+) comp9376_c0_seq1:63-1229(+)
MSLLKEEESISSTVPTATSFNCWHSLYSYSLVFVKMQPAKRVFGHHRQGHGVDELLQGLPKVELHAHLTGSVSSTTIMELLQEQGTASQFDNLEQIIKVTQSDSRTLDECFSLFPVIHQLLTTKDAIMKATRDVLREFKEDGVVYVELRTTPRANPETGMTKEAYLDTVIEAMNAASHEYEILAALVVSVDRSKSIEEAYENVQLAIDYAGNGVVGVDLSGNPHVGEFKELMPPLIHARRAGLKLTLHTGEIDNQEESKLMLAMLPERVGHATFVNHRSKLPCFRRIPVEVCLTSNLACKTVLSPEEHHLREIVDNGQLFVICTDDKGVFNCTLTGEYKRAFYECGIPLQTLAASCLAAVEYSFLEDERKDLLRRMVYTRMEELGLDI